MTTEEEKAIQEYIELCNAAVDWYVGFHGEKTLRLEDRIWVCGVNATRDSPPGPNTYDAISCGMTDIDALISLYMSYFATHDSLEDGEK